MGVLEEIQTTLTELANRVGPSVVGLGGGWRRGSGVVIASDRVLTTAHALRRREEPSVLFADGRRVPARTLGVDHALDLAVLEAETARVEALAVDQGEASPALGSPVVALARPGGGGLRATLGFVSAPERTFRGPRGRRVAAVEHTAPLPPGSSGGPLLTASGGALIGLNAVRQEGGLIVAIATAAHAATIAALGSGESPARRELGVAVAPAHVARRLRRAVGLPERDGLLIRRVREGGPAHRAGIERGDLIVSVDDREAGDVDALLSALDAVEDGRLELGIVRGTEERTVSVAVADAAE